MPLTIHPTDQGASARGAGDRLGDLRPVIGLCRWAVNWAKTGSPPPPPPLGLQRHASRLEVTDAANICKISPPPRWKQQTLIATMPMALALLDGRGPHRSW